MTKKARRARQALPAQTRVRADGTLALEVANVTQSVTLPADESTPLGGYWARMLPEHCPRRTLLLGLGGGTLAHLLARRCPGVALVGIEHDADVLAIARSDFGVDTLSSLEVVEADAFAWVEAHAHSEPGSYDLICLDLYEGGRLVPGTLARPFLRQLAALLEPQGMVTINLIRTARLAEQMHRIESVFTVAQQIRLWGNVVLHLQLPQSFQSPQSPVRSSSATH